MCRGHETWISGDNGQRAVQSQRGMYFRSTASCTLDTFECLIFVSVRVLFQSKDVVKDKAAEARDQIKGQQTRTSRGFLFSCVLTHLIISWFCCVNTCCLHFVGDNACRDCKEIKPVASDFATSVYRSTDATNALAGLVRRWLFRLGVGTTIGCAYLFSQSFTVVAFGLRLNAVKPARQTAFFLSFHFALISVCHFVCSSICLAAVQFSCFKNRRFYVYSVFWVLSAAKRTNTG